MSTSRVFCPSRANPAARLMLDVVLTVPPLCVEKLRIISLYRVYTLDISIDSVYPSRRASKKNFKSLSRKRKWRGRTRARRFRYRTHAHDQETAAGGRRG